MSQQEHQCCNRPSNYPLFRSIIMNLSQIIGREIISLHFGFRSCRISQLILHSQLNFETLPQYTAWDKMQNKTDLTFRPTNFTAFLKVFTVDAII